MDFLENDAEVPSVGDLMPPETLWQVPDKASSLPDFSLGDQLRSLSDRAFLDKQKSLKKGAANCLPAAFSSLPESTCPTQPFPLPERAGSSAAFDFPSPEWQTLLAAPQPTSSDLQDWPNLLAVPHTTSDAAGIRQVPDSFEATSTSPAKKAKCKNERGGAVQPCTLQPNGLAEDSPSDAQSAVTAPHHTDDGLRRRRSGMRSQRRADVDLNSDADASPAPRLQRSRARPHTHAKPASKPVASPTAFSAAQPASHAIDAAAAGQQPSLYPAMVPTSGTAVMMGMPQGHMQVPQWHDPHQHTWPAGQHAQITPALGIPCQGYLPQDACMPATAMCQMPGGYPYKGPSAPGHLLQHAPAACWPPGYHPGAEYHAVMPYGHVQAPTAVSCHKRASRLEICREKKRNRSTAPGIKIRYHMRQITAHMRPRLRGRFVKTSALQAARAQGQMEGADDKADGEEEAEGEEAEPEPGAASKHATAEALSSDDDDE